MALFYRVETIQAVYLVPSCLARFRNSSTPGRIEYIHPVGTSASPEMVRAVRVVSEDELKAEGVEAIILGESKKPA
ncbi:MAG: hypothetical protein WC869_00625 [Phycisphaerae bacterium]|jgi:hypothetical protein